MASNSLTSSHPSSSNVHPSNISPQISFVHSLSNSHHFFIHQVYQKNDLDWKTKLIPCPPSTICVDNIMTPNPVIISWTRQDQFLMSLLISSLSYETLPLVVGLPTSQDNWVKLESSLLSAFNTQNFQIHRQLQSLKQTPRLEFSLLLNFIICHGFCVSRVDASLFT